MTTEEKVELVGSVWETYGLGPALDAVELPTSTWYYHQKRRVCYEEKYAHLRCTLEKIARQHPEYGIPRVTVELRETYQQIINHKVVQRLLKLWNLAIMRSTRAPKPSQVRQVGDPSSRETGQSGRPNEPHRAVWSGLHRLHGDRVCRW